MHANLSLPAVGSHVRIKKAPPLIGQVHQITKTKIWIRVDGRIFCLARQAVELINSHHELHQQQGTKNRDPDNYKVNQDVYNSHKQKTIDLHGYTKAEALGALELFIDQALYRGYSAIKVIHGNGTGILRQAVRAYLDNHHLVQKIICDHPIQFRSVTWAEL